MKPPHLKVVENDGAKDIAPEIIANWQVVVAEALSGGATSGMVLYRNAAGDWGYACTPDMAQSDAWGLLDLCHRDMDFALHSQSDE